MRIVLLAAALAVATITPAFADELADAKAAIAAAKLSDASDLDMWCGAAMTLVSQATKDSNPDQSKAADAAATDFFTKAAASLAADGVKPEDLAALSTNYMVLASAQLVTQTDPPSHSTDDCTPGASSK